MSKWKFGLAVYCCLVLYASSLSQPDLPGGTGVKNFDKVLHFVEYAVMGILSWAALGRGTKGFAWGGFAFCVCFGIADECWQGLSGGDRNADVWDAAADASGAFVGLLFCRIFRKA
jgi:VanZ family protein